MWTGYVKLDLRNTDVNRGRARAVGRTEWVAVVREAEPELRDF